LYPATAATADQDTSTAPPATAAAVTLPAGAAGRVIGVALSSSLLADSSPGDPATARTT
jgi:hypothetical protein